MVVSRLPGPPLGDALEAIEGTSSTELQSPASSGDDLLPLGWSSSPGQPSPECSSFSAGPLKLD